MHLTLDRLSLNLCTCHLTNALSLYFSLFLMLSLKKIEMHTNYFEEMELQANMWKLLKRLQVGYL